MTCQCLKLLEPDARSLETPEFLMPREEKILSQFFFDDLIQKAYFDEIQIFHFRMSIFSNSSNDFDDDLTIFVPPNPELCQLIVQQVIFYSY